MAEWLAGRGSLQGRSAKLPKSRVLGNAGRPHGITNACVSHEYAVLKGPPMCLLIGARTHTRH